MDGHNEQRSRVKLTIVVAMIGLLSVALGFTLEATKIQLDDVIDPYGQGCTYPSHSHSITLGVLAIVALLAFRVYCPETRNSSSMVQLSRYLSWVAWFVAMIFYIFGVLMTTKQGDTLEYVDGFESYYSCNVVKPGIFGAGASFALTSVILENVYLVVSQQQNDKTTSDPSTQPSNVAMC
ncbi:hypothetical protein QVD17_30095 [Tagetes erecta]|uniref:Uncharacterized protein n=1 Tax=Tagetes erecta TaxID=13708 RepID=A0AAD8K3J9_TARER|nr:hypothetical protein QVD17_30095 [Tagetes erecta]